MNLPHMNKTVSSILKEISEKRKQDVEKFRILNNDILKEINEINIFNLGNTSIFRRFLYSLNFKEKTQEEIAYNLWVEKLKTIKEVYANLDDFINDLTVEGREYNNGSYDFTLYRHNKSNFTINAYNLDRLKKYLEYKKMEERLPPKNINIKEKVRKI